MVSVGGEVESQPSTSNCNKYKLPRTLLVGCGAVNHASVPRKLRSAIKNRVRESVKSPLLISKKRHVSKRIDALGKHGMKKYKPKKGHISKDEEEVAETLFALASIFSESTTKSSAIQETGSSMNAVEDNVIPTVREESTKTSSVVILESTCHSPNFLDTKAQFVESQSSGGANKKDVIDLEQVPASEAQYNNNYYLMDHKYNGLFQSQTGNQSSETQRSCQRLPAWLESTNFTSQPSVTDINISTERGLVAVQSKKSWKRSSAHIYISRLIKVLQISEKKDVGSPQMPTQLTTVIDDRNCGAMSFNGIIDSAVEKSLSEIQDQQLAAGTTSALYSAKEGCNFLSLGMEVCGHDLSRDVNRAGQSYAAPKQVHASYVQSQNHPNVLFSLDQNGYSSTYRYGDKSALAAQKVQLHQYLGSSSPANNGSFTARVGWQKQKRTDQLRNQYNVVGVGSSHLPEWRNGKTELSSTDVNCAQALFPHLLGYTKHQQFIPPSEQHRLMSVNSSSSLPTVKMNQHRQFQSRFERNGQPPLYYGNAQQFL